MSRLAGGVDKGIDDLVACPSCGGDWEHGWVRAFYPMYWIRGGRPSVQPTVEELEGKGRAHRCVSCSVVAFEYDRGLLLSGEADRPDALTNANCTGCGGQAGGGDIASQTSIVWTQKRIRLRPSAEKLVWRADQISARAEAQRCTSCKLIWFEY